MTAHGADCYSREVLDTSTAEPFATVEVFQVPAVAQNICGSETGPTGAKGYSHPDQFIHLKDVKPADNMYPVIAHPEQCQWQPAARRP
jgi:hypothetical protein